MRKPPAEKIDGVDAATIALALSCLIEQFPHRQLNATELRLGLGIGQTAMSQIMSAPDSPFSYQKCTAARVNEWLQNHPRLKVDQ
jgi:hypothetical protein